MKSKLGWIRSYLGQKFFIPGNPVQINPKEFFRIERRAHLKRCYNIRVAKESNS